LEIIPLYWRYIQNIGDNSKILEINPKYWRYYAQRKNQIFKEKYKIFREKYKILTKNSKDKQYKKKFYQMVKSIKK